VTERFPVEAPVMDCLTAVVGSRGLRSVGRIAIDYLVEKFRPSLIRELYSEHFPIWYQTQPSYAPHPLYPGRSGVWLHKDGVQLPRIEFYLSNSPKLLLTKGYHANFQGQYKVAEQALDLYEKLGVKQVFVLAGYGVGDGEVCCAATDLSLIDELKRHGVGTGYEGPFIGFSGLVLGLAKLRSIRAACIFGRTQPNLEDPEFPDISAARMVLEKLSSILNFDLDLSTLKNKPAGRVEPAVIGW